MKMKLIHSFFDCLSFYEVFWVFFSQKNEVIMKNVKFFIFEFLFVLIFLINFFIVIQKSIDFFH